MKTALLLLSLPFCSTALSFHSTSLTESQRQSIVQRRREQRVARLLKQGHLVPAAVEQEEHDDETFIKASLIELQCARSLFIPAPAKTMPSVHREASKLPGLGDDIKWEEMGLVRRVLLRRSRKSPISLVSESDVSWEEMGLARSLRLRSPCSEGTVVSLPLATRAAPTSKAQPARVFTPSFPEMSKEVHKVMSQPTQAKDSALVSLKYSS